MERNLAIEKLASKRLKELTEKERIEQLEVMPLEDWTDNSEWKLLPKNIRKEYDEGEFIDNPNSNKYDDVLLIWLKSSLQAISNEYLESELDIENVFGNVFLLEPCPCCGARTIGERAEYDICKVCWWEDDGQDNKEADIIMGGPNYGISLTQGRINYLKFGIYDPSRKDLIEQKDKIEMYEIGRVFIIENEYIIEQENKWKSKITNA